MKRFLYVLVALLILPSLLFAQTNQQTSNITTNGDCVILSSLGMSNGTISITGTWTGTISFTAQIGTAAYDTLSLLPIPSGAAVTSTTANGRWTLGQAYTNIRACATATMTGTAVVNFLVTSARGGGGGLSNPVTAAQGGTGLTTAAVGDLIYASATTPTWSRLAIPAAGSVLVSGTTPAWSISPTLGTGANGPIPVLALNHGGSTNDGAWVTWKNNGTNHAYIAPVSSYLGGTYDSSMLFAYTGSFYLISRNSSVKTLTSTEGIQIGAPTGGDKGAGTLNAAGAYYANGTVGCTGVPTASTTGIATTCTSDERLKTNIVAYTRGLTDLVKVQPISFKWKVADPDVILEPEKIEPATLDKDGMFMPERVIPAKIKKDARAGFADTDPTVQDTGLGAQNVMAAIPEAVSPATQADGKTWYTIHDRVILGVAINAIKELAARVAALEKK